MRYFLYRTLKCALFFYIAHLGVRYEIYTLALPFDLRCQSDIYENTLQWLANAARWAAQKVSKILVRKGLQQTT